MREAKPKRRAFTLVELLVVIGIIAILIGVLLPTLAKARQSANFIDCQARLRQMGTALHMYVNTNKGMLPWGAINHNNGHLAGPADGLPNAGYKEEVTWWYFTLSETMTRRLADPDGLVRNISGVFHDKDVIEGSDGRYVNHYVANQRLFYFANENDDVPLPSIAAPNRTPRKIGSVRRQSEMFVIWDAPQAMNLEYNAYGIASAIDVWGIYNYGLCEGNSNVIYDRAIVPGEIGTIAQQPGPGKVFQKKYNRDVANGYNTAGWPSHLRFRHKNNTRLAALCLDGHVESREVGTVMVRDIVTNPR